MTDSLPPAGILTVAGWVHLAIFGVLLPVLVVRDARRISSRELPLPPRIIHFRAASAMLLLWTGVSVAVAAVQRIDLFPREVPPLRGVAAGFAMYVGAVLGMRPLWRQAVAKRAPIVHLFAAETRQERAWWLVVALLAGIGEEITWRGVQTALLVPLVGNYWGAAVLCAISFAVAHSIQGWKSVLGIIAFALAFQLVVVATGSLYVAMAVHVAYDITAGLAYGRLAREMGYVPDMGAGVVAQPDPV